MLAGKQAGADALLRVLRPLMVRHTKNDLALPPPVFLPDWEARLCAMPDESERRFTARVCAAVAGQVAQVMGDARREWSKAQREWEAIAHEKRAPPPPRPRAVVFSEYLNDLEQVRAQRAFVLEGCLGDCVRASTAARLVACRRNSFYAFARGLYWMPALPSFFPSAPHGERAPTDAHPSTRPPTHPLVAALPASTPRALGTPNVIPPPYYL
jgi:hypothetical protein